MVGEANHYTLFSSFARNLGKGIDVNKRWQEFLEYEAGVIAQSGDREMIHG